MSDEQNIDNGPKELREALDRQTARADAAETGLKQFQAQTFFEKAGLGEKQAELFLKTNPDAEITSESVSTFIEDYGFQVAEEAAPPAPASEPPADAGLGALSGAGGTSTGAAPAAAAKVSKADFTKLLEENPAEAAKLYVEGRVERNEHNVQAREMVRKGIINH